MSNIGAASAGFQVDSQVCYWKGVSLDSEDQDSSLASPLDSCETLGKGCNPLNLRFHTQKLLGLNAYFMGSLY